ncbi:hypothetical protein C1645_764565, partial [Glomus cerebriforme]
MNRSIHLFIFGFLGLLVFLNFGASAVCFKSPNCDCDPANIQGCNVTSLGFTATTRSCGSEFNCTLVNDIFQINADGNFCHFGPCTKGCTIQAPNSFC